MSDHLQFHINGQQTFFISQRILSKYSKKVRRIIKQEKQQGAIRIDDFPGGSEGFELVSRFCYNNGSISITFTNVPLLYSCALFLGMTETASCPVNLLHQTEVFLEGLFYWSWNDILTCLKSCELCIDHAESSGLVDKLLCSLLAKIAQISDVNLLSASSSSSSSSPDTASHSSSSRKAWAWWFQDLTVLGPRTIEDFLKALGAYGSDNNNLVLTKFLLHYLKTAGYHSVKNVPPTEYAVLADTAVHGVVLMGRTAFSCRGVFWVLRIVSGFGLSRECRAALERLIGGMLDHATLDDLLVSGGVNGGVYDVNLIVRLIKLFVQCNEEVTLPKLQKVAELIDMYLGEIGPDPNLKVSKFLGVAESLPDCARDSFDQVYRAIDIYLQSHPALPLEERSKLCRCLNYEKLSLEACKDLAKNPRIPPTISVQALRSQHSNVCTSDLVDEVEYVETPRSRRKSSNKTKDYQMVLYENNDEKKFVRPEKEGKVNLEKMQGRVVELEKVCREMRVQMARMAKMSPQQNRQLPRMC